MIFITIGSSQLPQRSRLSTIIDYHSKESYIKYLETLWIFRFDPTWCLNKTCFIERFLNQFLQLLSKKWKNSPSSGDRVYERHCLVGFWLQSYFGGGPHLDIDIDIGPHLDKWWSWKLSGWWQAWQKGTWMSTSGRRATTMMMRVVKYRLGSAIREVYTLKYTACENLSWIANKLFSPKQPSPWLRRCQPRNCSGWWMWWGSRRYCKVIK